jgi:threonine synthase
MAQTGLFVEPTSASAAAALDVLAQRGAIRANERTVVIISGTGIKAASLITELLASG